MEKTEKNREQQPVDLSKVMDQRRPKFATDP